MRDDLQNERSISGKYRVQNCRLFLHSMNSQSTCNACRYVYNVKIKAVLKTKYIHLLESESKTRIKSHLEMKQIHSFRYKTSLYTGNNELVIHYQESVRNWAISDIRYVLSIHNPLNDDAWPYICVSVIVYCLSCLLKYMCLHKTSSAA